jgi:DmsE family decaheme c-type cytochrome
MTMPLRNALRAAIQAVVLACVCSFAAQAAAPAAPKKAPEDVIFKGDGKCTGCHDENDNAPVLAIGKTRHGVKADGRNTGCVGCHGESKLHEENPKGLSERPKVDRAYTKKSTTPVAERNEACLNCHNGNARSHWTGSQHEMRDVACTHCHQIHTDSDRVLKKTTQAEVCYTCHKTQRAESHRISVHPLDAGKMACTDCHNPHGSTGPKLMAKNSINDTCYSCHAEKRGPFLWEHPPAVDNCINCHTPHGSTNAGLLKMRSPWLCQRCHGDGAPHPGAIYSGANLPGGLVNSINQPTTGATSFTNPLTGQRIAQTNPASQLALRGCANCHSQVHGSNHPAGKWFVR